MRLLLPVSQLPCLALGVLLMAAPAVGQVPLPEDRLPADLFPKAPPLGMLKLHSPTYNPLTEGSFKLGRKLFFDPILSVNHKVSCASCHQPEHGFSSPVPRPEGIHGRRTYFTAPTLYNRNHPGAAQGWDGAVGRLEQRVAYSIQAPDEMGLPLEEAAQRLHEHPDYRAEFDRIYANGVSEVNVTRALGSFVRGLVIGDTPVDRFFAGLPHDFTPAERSGMWIFQGKGGCWRCHSGRNYTDELFHNTGIGVLGGVPDDGRFGTMKEEWKRGRFKTPTLRGLVHTAPYMHDGSLKTLEEVVDYYASGGNANPWLDKRVRPFQLTDRERANLLAFLRALSRKDPTPK